MSDLKDFLLKLTTDTDRYYAEMVDNIAEIYIDNSSGPAALLEVDGKCYHVNFRCDMTSQLVAQMMNDMSKVDRNIVAGPDFYVSPDDGISYGEQALGLYFSSIIQAFEIAQAKQENEELDESTYVVKQPIYAYGNKKNGKSSSDDRMQRLWGTDLE